MRILGLDIGTTSLSALVLDSETGKVLDTRTLPNPGVIAGCVGQQDGTKTLLACVELIRQLKPQVLGVTGQMHGLIYLNDRLRPVSSLYTWQDRRGEEKSGEMTLAQQASVLSGYPLASGYGLLTDWINRSRGLVPKEACLMTTIPGALTAMLTGQTAQHASMAASWGCFATDHFSLHGLKQLNTPTEMLPLISEDREIFSGLGGLWVAPAIGDNQASVLGSLPPEDRLLVNVGTGSQVSLLTAQPCEHPDLETRPYFDGKSLLVGASLCGGNTYAALEGFFRRVVKMAGGEESVPLYQAMEACMETLPKDLPAVNPRLDGSRAYPAERGSISGLSRDNFTPQGMIGGFLSGMAQELLQLYKAMAPALEERPSRLVASGNGVRKNPLLCRALTRAFDLPLVMTASREEAALGAALYAGVCAGCFASWQEASSLLTVREA